MNYKNHPKIELHLHLDCSLSYEVAQQLNPSISEKEYQDSFIAPDKCLDLSDYISRAVKGIELMQTKQQLRWVTLDLFQQLKKDNVIYAEIRFAPLLHTAGGLRPEEVVSVVNKAVAEGIAEYEIDAGIILCTLRNYSQAQGMETVQLVKKFKGTHVVGFDIASDEANFPIDEHIKAFQFAKEHGINCTAHAGEAKGAESVVETLENFQPVRIGHGVRSIEDPDLLKTLKQKKIHLEVCPTSNIQVDVFDTIQDHSVDKLYKAGISVGINTDARAISNVTLTQEYQLLQEVFGWKSKDFKKCNLEAIEHSFASEEMKEKLRLEIERGYSE
ncbi:adenosine deaminase [Lutimonas sp.]|uniref:adenosine deaminase n=1 Tax=Lutimonas sp. TaxID=1872403 RepID=UPI003D9B19AA